jgi:hypothetical protein
VAKPPPLSCLLSNPRGRGPLDLPFLTKEAKKQVIANAVPLQIDLYVAELINSATCGSKIHVAQPKNTITSNSNQSKSYEINIMTLEKTH